LLLAGGEVLDQSDNWARFVVIMYKSNRREFVFSGRLWHSTTSSYICQLQQQGLSEIRVHFHLLCFVQFVEICIHAELLLHILYALYCSIALQSGESVHICTPHCPKVGIRALGPPQDHRH